ncbi:MAG: hypothetical protein OSB65_11585 [Roseibacillus sp.]|nr:hypothetical protein [Roseibacillus sp.]
MKRSLLLALCTFLPAILGAEELRTKLSKLPYRLVYEAYDGDNWELFVMNADGSGKKNLTNTKNRHELYPQASPDGSMICFINDVGAGRKVVRSVCVMKADGTDRRTVAEYARQPFWSADSKLLGYLPQEFRKFNIVDYFSKGLRYYEVASGKDQAHPNAENLHHLYNPSAGAKGKWIASTVHAGMGYKHAILLLESNGSVIHNLQIGGCRPSLSPDGKMIAWGENDHRIAVAELEIEDATPKVGRRLLNIFHPMDKIYHVDWAPDSVHLSFSRGLPSKGDLSKPGTHEAACEMVGIYAKGWDIFVVALPPDEGTTKTINLSTSGPEDFARITENGLSNKESTWLNSPPKR